MTQSSAIRPVDPALMRVVPIPGLPLHDVIYSIATGSDGKIYLGLSSEFASDGFARLAVYDPATDLVSTLLDLRELLPEGRAERRPPHSKMHTTLCVARRRYALVRVPRDRAAARRAYPPHLAGRG